MVHDMRGIGFSILTDGVEIVKECATDHDRSEQETVVYTVIRRGNIYSQPVGPVLEPENSNVLPVYISPLNNWQTRAISRY